MFGEERKLKRFRSKEGAFAAFIRPKDLRNMGQIQDIGMGAATQKTFYLIVIFHFCT
jgi:hypothetical protein